MPAPLEGFTFTFQPSIKIIGFSPFKSDCAASMVIVYISLVPNETKTITIEAAQSDLKGEKPIIFI